MSVPFVLLLLLWAAGTADALSLLNKGLLALQQKNFSVARENLEQAARLDPQNGFVQVALAEAYWQTGDHARAHASASRAAALPSLPPPAAHGLSLFYLREKNLKQAAAFERRFAEGSSPANYAALAHAAQLYAGSGDLDEAIALARRCAQDAPTAQSLGLFGSMLAERGDLGQALDVLSDAQRLAPSDPAIAFQRSQIFLKKRDFDNAASALEPALQAHAADPQLELALGVARYGQRRFDEAAGALRGWEHRYNWQRFSTALKGETPGEKLERLLPGIRAA